MGRVSDDVVFSVCSAAVEGQKSLHRAYYNVSTAHYKVQLQCIQRSIESVVQYVVPDFHLCQF